MRRSWDIFCSVVDNYGDIGVCWRLARQLAAERDQAVRLWVDDLGSFTRLCPAVATGIKEQAVAGVEIRHWDAAAAHATPAEVVVEGFGARLPDPYVLTMAERRPRPVWINLEYLTAEAWADGCHGLPSPHPRLPLIKHFFFPGFTDKTGGLLVEHGLVEARDRFQRDSHAVANFWSSVGVCPARPDVTVSLFCYDNAALPTLVDAWSNAPARVLCVVPAGRAAAQLAPLVGSPVGAGSRIDRGQLTIAGIDFLELDRYDRLLWACDLNFVRGEDSFVRAQLAARPLLWHAYPQDKGAHRLKVNAFLDRYAGALATDAGQWQRAVTEAWNAESAAIGALWRQWADYASTLTAHARAWSDQLASGGNLAAKLAEFAEDRLK